MFIFVYHCLYDIIFSSQAYFINADVDEVRANLLDLGATRYAYELVKRAVMMSMDRADKERELVSRLLSELYPDVLSRSAIGKGFERLLEGIDELEKDAPAARTITACFIARCVVDEVLPPAFLTDAVVASLGGDVIDHAKRLLSMEHHGARLEHVWGPGDGRPASEMKEGVDQLLQEYLLSGDAEEAAKCVRQINAPHFHAEIVKRAVILGLNKTEAETSSLHALLLHLLRHEVLSTSQAQRGFRLVKARLSDISLDVPRAPAALAEWTQRARADGLVDKDF
jgi:programmed cell death protein 4